MGCAGAAVPLSHKPAAAHVCGFLHESLTDVVHPVFVQAQAVVPLWPLHHALDVLAYELVQLLKHHLGLLLRAGSGGSSSGHGAAAGIA